MFEQSLAEAPNRLNGLGGAARAADLSGDLEKAETYYRRMVELCTACDRPITRHAAEFLRRQ